MTPLTDEKVGDGKGYSCASGFLDSGFLHYLFDDCLFRTRESIQLIAYRYDVAYAVLYSLNGGWKHGSLGWPKAGETLLVPDHNRTINDDKNWSPFLTDTESDAVIPEAEGKGITEGQSGGQTILVFQECSFDSPSMGWGYEIGDSVNIIGRGTGPCTGWSTISEKGFSTGWIANEKFLLIE